jgi:hypothetical protein
MTQAKATAAMPQMDWQQVVLNGGPPCFAVLTERPSWYCGRAQRWDGHGYDHKFVSLSDLVINERDALLREVAQLRSWKESAMSLLTSYDTIAKSFGGALGSSKVKNLERGVDQLREALEGLAWHSQNGIDVCWCDVKSDGYAKHAPQCVAARAALSRKGD